MRRAFAKAAIAVLLCAQPALANNFEIIGGSPRSTAMGGAQTAEANDYSAVFYNPSLLAVNHELETGVAFSYLHVSSQVTPTDLSKPLDCTYCAPLDSSGLTFGISAPLQGKLKDRVSVGLSLYAPTDAVARTRAADPSRPFWYHYDNNPERLVVFMGAGVRIIDGVYLGAGAQVLADLVGNGANMNVDVFAKQVKFREIDSYLALRASPTAGLTLVPSSRLRFGLSYRHEMSLFYSIPGKFDLGGIGTLAFVLSGYNHYTPPTFTGGVGFDATDNISLSFDLSYEMWHLAPSPYVDLTVDLSGDVLTALGLDNALDLNVPHRSPGLADTMNARLGFEYRVSPSFVARAGALYRPTPVPRQDVPGTNMLDGNRLGLTGGIGVSFQDPLELAEAPMIFDLGVSASELLPRDAVKESTDPVPGYTYTGVVLGAQATLRYRFGGPTKEAAQKPAPPAPAAE